MQNFITVTANLASSLTGNFKKREVTFLQISDKTNNIIIFFEGEREREREQNNAILPQLK